MVTRAACVVAALTLSGCAFTIDADQARTCRASLPAVAPANARPEILRLHAPATDAIRITYRIGVEGPSSHERFVLCRFGPNPLARGGSDLVALVTEHGEVSGASLYLLKRYYLDSPDSLATIPEAEDAGLPELSPTLAYAAEHALAGLPRTAIYGLLAAAYALVFGLVGRINIAFGDIAAIGSTALGLAATALWAGGVGAPLAGIAAGLFVAVAAAALHNLAVGSVAFAAIPGRRVQASLIATVGLSLALSEYLRLAGGAPLWIPPLGNEPVALARAGTFTVVLAPVTILTAAIGIAAALALLGLMWLTAFGRMWRAAADDPWAAALCGIDARRLLGWTLLISGALAGFAGALVTLRFGPLGFAGGFGLGLKALAAAVVGGIGSVGGALAGGLAIGVFETLWSALMPIELRDIALFVLLVVAIACRPNRLDGQEPLKGPR